MCSYLYVLIIIIVSFINFLFIYLVPLYLTPKYRYQMINIITREMNRVYGSYIKRNPSFSGKVSIVGHSLGVKTNFFHNQNIKKKEKKKKKNPNTIFFLFSFIYV